MNEEQLFDKIFGLDQYKEGFDLFYCETCGIFSIQCKECKSSYCGASGNCDKCKEEFINFTKKKTSPFDYLSLSNEEYKVIYKWRRMKNLMKESLARGENELDWQKLKENGELSNVDLERFKEFLK